MSLQRRLVTCSLALALSAAPASRAAGAPARRVSTPISCTRGGDKRLVAIVSAPASVAPGATFRVRIGAVDSGKLDNSGLHYIHDMQTDFIVPSGAEVVEGSARVVPGTGSSNAREGAKVVADESGIHLKLPAHIEKGGSYTAPTLELKLRATAKAGEEISIQFSHYEVVANAAVVGDVHSSCEPTKPAVLAKVKVGGGGKKGSGQG